MSNLLFIDDEVHILKTYQNIFRPKIVSGLEQAASSFFEAEIAELPEGPSFAVTTAQQGMEGLQLVKQALSEGIPFKVVFIDMRMPPGIDGKETAKRIRQADPKVEIVLVTAYADANLKDVVDEVGAADKLLYLKKPFDVEEIRQLALNLTTKYNSDRAKDEFLSNVSHELRTPLASILGFNQLLGMNESLDPEAREYNDIMGKNANLMKTLIEELLASIEFQGKGVKLKLDTVSMIPYLQDIYKSLTPIFNVKKDTKFLLSLPNNDELYCDIDLTRLTQCVNNLVVNAFKFTESGSVTLGLEANDEEITIFVQDTGIGIPESHHHKVFEKFHRVENEYHTRPGLGLGLYVVFSIIQAHGGRISLMSRENEGSRFSLHLKRKG